MLEPQLVNAARARPSPHEAGRQPERPGPLQNHGLLGSTCDENGCSDDTARAAAKKAKVKPRFVPQFLQRLGPHDSIPETLVAETNFQEPKQTRPSSGPNRWLLWSQFLEPDEITT